MTSLSVFKMHVLVMLVVTCFVGLGSVNAETEVSLTLKPLGESHYKAIGDAMVFTCEVEVESDDDDGDDKSTVYELKWFDPKGQEVVEKTGRMYVEEEDNLKKLYLTEFVVGDEGKYRCQMLQGGRKIQEKTFNLTLYGHITFKDTPSVQTQRIYTDALVKCVVTGYPTPEVTWRHKGARLPLGGRYQKVSNGLIISNATRDDDGNYTCRAEVETDGRMEERVIQLFVHIPPTITSEPGKLIGVEGDTISLSCRASALPSATFTFYKGGVQLVSSSRVQVDAAAGTVYFRPLSKSDEDKSYTCTATNDVGSDTGTGSLTVQVKPSITELNNVTESENKVATLVCLSRGDPAPDITFSRLDQPADFQTGSNGAFGNSVLSDLSGFYSDDVELNSGKNPLRALFPNAPTHTRDVIDAVIGRCVQDDDRIVVRQNEPYRLELAINNLRPSDAGNYQCKATSSLGESKSQAKLTVKYKPVFPDEIRTEYIWATKSRNFSCHPSAEPLATMEWFRYDQPIGNNGTYRIFTLAGESLLQITVREQDQSWVYGDYKCAARNELGVSDLVIDLRRANVPDAPKLVTVNSTTPTGIMITVEAPVEDGGMPVTGYRVQYNDKLHDITSVSTEGTEANAPPYNTDAAGATTDSDSNHIEIENLKPSTTYILRVSAKNEVGLGPNAFQINVTTADIRKPYPVVISSPKNGEHAMHYHVTWNKPNTGGMPIDEYQISYRRVRIENGKDVTPDGEWVKRKTSDVSTDPKTQFHLDSLEPNTHYELQIVAHNSIDWSEPNGEFVFRTAPATEADLRILAQRASIGAGPVILIVILIVIVALIALDLACFVFKKCGVTMLLCRRYCPSNVTRTDKEKALDDSEKQHLTCKTEDVKANKTNESEDVKLEEINEKDDHNTAPSVIEDEKEPLKKEMGLTDDDNAMNA